LKKFTLTVVAANLVLILDGLSLINMEVQYLFLMF